jgi:hypothetical protein
MKNGNSLIALGGILLLTTACRPARTKSSDLPPQIVVVPGALDVRPERKADGTTGVSYSIREPYPADGVLARIRAALQPPGWKPMPMDWMNPDIPSSHERGWVGFTDDASKGRQTYVHQWSAQWRDTRGNVVYYDLRYISQPPKGGAGLERPDNEDLYVTAVWVPKAVADRMMAWGADMRSKDKGR